MPKITVPSGADVEINAASWHEANTLRTAIQTAVSSELKDADRMSQLLVIGMKVEANPVVNAALWPCLARCTYNSQRINDAIFEDVKARQDYMEIVTACIKENLAPFMKTPVSQFLTFLGQLNQNGEAPASK